MSETQATIRLVQITDFHLFSSPTDKLIGMNCNDSLDAVLSLVNKQQKDIDLILCTGDLVQDGSEEGYRVLKDKLDDYSSPSYWLCGNHDERASIIKALGDQPQELSLEVVVGNWQILMLDTQVPGRIHGRLAEDELERLQKYLQKSEQAGQHSLLCLHHNPVPVEASWLQKHSLKNPQQLFEVLQNFSHVKGLIHGHIHQEKHDVVNGISIWSTPSTCVQFHPENDKFTIDKTSPGYRWMQLQENGEIITGVERVKDIKFDIDFDSAGY